MDSACFKYYKEDGCDNICPYYDSDYACLNQMKIHSKILNYNEITEYLKKHNIKFENHHHGLLINDKFIFSTSTYKWCNKNKYKWYRSKGIEDFLTKYAGYDNGNQSASYRDGGSTPPPAPNNKSFTDCREKQ